MINHQLKKAITFLSVTVGLVAGGGAASAVTFTPLVGFTDTDFNGLKNDLTIEEDWVAEGRIGGVTTFEQGIVNWKTNTNNNPAGNPFTTDMAEFNWISGQAVSFSLNYNPINNGTLTYTLGNTTLVESNITESPRIPEINALLLRTRSANNSTITLQNLLLNGISYGSNLVSSGNGDIDYLQISDFNAPFILTGEAILQWTGTRPIQSQLAFQVKGIYDSRVEQPPVGVPEPATLVALLAVSGFGAFLKREPNKNKKSKNAASV